MENGWKKKLNFINVNMGITLINKVNLINYLI